MTGVSQFTPPSVELRVDRVLRMQGYDDLARVRPSVRSMAEAVTALAGQLLEPVVHYARSPVESCAGGALVLRSGTVFRCPAFDKYLAGCTEVVVFVLTLGQAFDRIGRNFAAADKLVESFMLETAGWLGVEQVTKLFSTHLRGVVKRDGLRLGRRMSPGYGFRVDGRRCGWRLEEQKLLFSLLEGEPLPVKLLESCAMDPKMSRSGLFGLVPRSGGAD